MTNQASEDELERVLIAYCEGAEGITDGGKTARRFINQIRQNKNHHAREQIKEVLDRLESQLQDPNNAEFYDENYDRLMSFDEWLLSERNKLKESK